MATASSTTARNLRVAETYTDVRGEEVKKRGVYGSELTRCGGGDHAQRQKRVWGAKHQAPPSCTRGFTALPCRTRPAARGGAGCVPKGFAECGGANTLDPVANPKAGDLSSKASGGDNVRGDASYVVTRFIDSSRALSPVIPEQVSTSRKHRLHPMKQPREVPPATFSALGLVCSSKMMAGRESRKYSSTYESSLYVGSVLKVLLDHRRSSNSKQSVGISARLSSCDELPRPTDSSSRCSWLALHLPAQERLAGRGIIISKQPTQGAASKKA
eukprot:scaffold59922_cov49-Phaeocystis_antarctica.AAC.3